MGASQQEGKILLVEDEIFIAMAEQLTLERHGYTVQIVSSGEKAIAAVDEDPEIGLVLMDINLGVGMRGTEAAERILANHDLPLVFLSSHTEPDVVEMTSEITSYGYIVKNSGDTVLTASVAMAFRLHEAQLALQQQKRQWQEAEETFRALFEKGPIGVAYHKMLYDEQGTPVDYLFLDANESFMRLTGTDPRGKRATQAFPGLEDDPADWIGQYGRIARDGGEVRFQQYLEANHRWYDCVAYQSKPDHFVAAFMEITDRKRAEEVAQEHTRKYAELSTIINHSPICAFIWDLSDGWPVRFVTENVLHLLGYPAESFLSGAASYAAMIHPDDVDRILAEGRNHRAAEEWEYTQEYRLIDAAGRTLWVDDWTRVILNEAGEAVMVHGTIRDITDRKQAQEEIAHLAREKETLLLEMVHRIKNNFSMVESSLQMQADRSADREVQSALLDAVSRVTSMRALYDALLVSDRYDTVPLGPYLENIARSVLDAYREQCTVELSFSADTLSLPPRTVFPLGAIVAELMTNALKYAFPRDTGGVITLELERNEGGGLLRISDNGQGFPKDVNAERSDSFGIALVHMLAEQIGGGVTLTTTPGSGTVATIQFPTGETAQKS